MCRTRLPDASRRYSSWNSRGPVEAKHERRHEMFFLNRLKPEFSRDPAGRRPNQSFAAEYDRLTGRAPAQILREPSLH